MSCKTVCKIRVRYGETDQMGYVYYGNYALYLEQARTDWLRKMGHSYKSLEAENILLPVTQLSINYHAPGHYDDLLEIETTLNQKPAVKIEFFYTIYNQENKRLVTAQTTLAFVDKKTGKIRQAPDYLLESIDKNMKS
ncbi:MAG: acyl-CoA thioesterase [Flavobacteriaceae bacterium]|nr:acyl-CoA thioesterase [Flavobacteriaceae bacterium]